MPRWRACWTRWRPSRAWRACLLTFDEFVSGTEIFGERIQPLMKSRQHVAQMVKAAE